jgi:hypothetical protein
VYKKIMDSRFTSFQLSALLPYRGHEGVDALRASFYKLDRDFAEKLYARLPDKTEEGVSTNMQALASAIDRLPDSADKPALMARKGRMMSEYMKLNSRFDRIWGTLPKLSYDSDDSDDERNVIGADWSQDGGAGNPVVSAAVMALVVAVMCAMPH